jgi:septum formation protein
VVPDVEELGEGDPVAVARENARRKAEAVAADAAADVAVIGVDTVVVLGDAIYGKPRDAAHAKEMLQALSGREHTVVSGLAIRRAGATELLDDATKVRFRDLSPLLDWYLPHEEWRERAGAYAIQGRGAAFVESISGDYLNVVGLPVAALLDRWPGVLNLAR